MKPSDDYLRADVASIRDITSWTWQPEYKYKRIFFKECPIAGLSFHLEKEEELWEELQEGTKLAVIREKGNKYDRNAVAVALADDYDEDPGDFDFDFILGYVPRTDNAALAAMLDAGYGDIFSAEITTYHRFGNYDDRIRITIYLETKKPEIVRPDLLRGLSLSTCELKKMCSELTLRGTAHFRFGGYPHFDLQYPEVGKR